MSARTGTDRRPVVVSLTAAGARLGQRVCRLVGPAEHAHRPEGFAGRVREWFRDGRPLLLITATGIAVRALSPVVDDKRHDPPVLVLDQAGRFVVPLLSGHEGGANEWGRQVAGALGAQLVLTTASAYTHPLHVAGLGCERGCSSTAIEAVLDTVLAAAGLSADDLDALASIDVKADETGLIELAARLDRPLRTYPAARLRAHHGALSDHSEHVMKAVGCYGVAEAAALEACSAETGGRAELLVAKHKGARATAALARAFREND